MVFVYVCVCVRMCVCVLVKVITVLVFSFIFIFVLVSVSFRSGFAFSWCQFECLLLFTNLFCIVFVRCNTKKVQKSCYVSNTFSNTHNWPIFSTVEFEVSLNYYNVVLCVRVCAHASTDTLMLLNSTHTGKPCGSETSEQLLCN